MSSHLPINIEFWGCSPPGGNEVDKKLEITIIFTDRQGTLAALKTAGMLTDQLRARTNLLVAQIVPLPFPLASPPVAVRFIQQQLLDLVEQSNVKLLDVLIDLYLCRDRLSCILDVLRPQSLVIVGIRKRWWSKKEPRLVAMLERAGHRVIFANLAG